MNIKPTKDGEAESLAITLKSIMDKQHKLEMAHLDRIRDPVEITPLPQRQPSATVLDPPVQHSPQPHGPPSCGSRISKYIATSLINLLVDEIDPGNKDEDCSIPEDNIHEQNLIISKPRIESHRSGVRRSKSNNELYSDTTCNNNDISELENVNTTSDNFGNLKHFPYIQVVIRPEASLQSPHSSTVRDQHYIHMRRSHRRTRSDVEVQSIWLARTSKRVDLEQKQIYVKPAGSIYGNFIQRGKSHHNKLEAQNIYENIKRTSKING